MAISTLNAAEEDKLWPFRTDEFDKSPALTEVEKRALSAWHEVWNKPFIRRLDLEMPLHRFTHPIALAVQHFRYVNEAQVKRTVTGYILLAMHHKQSTFWSWSDQDWLDIIGNTHEEYHALVRTKKTAVRLPLIVCAYLLHGSSILSAIRELSFPDFAVGIFGRSTLFESIKRVQEEGTRIGLGHFTHQHLFPRLLCELFLLNRSADLHQISLEQIKQLHRKYTLGLRRACTPLSRVFHNLGIIPQPLIPNKQSGRSVRVGVEDTVPAEWLAWTQRWFDTSTNFLTTRKATRGMLAKAGRWFAATYPTSTSPTEWTRDTAIAYVAAVDRMPRGAWCHAESRVPAALVGKPLTPNGKNTTLAAVRLFFSDCQSWGWLPPKFNPHRDLALPRSISRLRAPAPRVIADAWWAKLMSAGLNLTKEDLPKCSTGRSKNPNKTAFSWYPFELVRAVTIVWLFAGLRASEIKRLRLGCARLQNPDGENLSIAPDSKKMVCLLSIPVSKTATAYTKPVEPLVGYAIQEWEKIRPAIAPSCDAKTGEMVDFLFVWRGLPISSDYINDTVIPMLCEKAGVPEADARGPISSHRARSTIASQLYNAVNGMKIYDLKAWLGHRSIRSTEYYIQHSPTKLSKAYTDAEYFSRNVRMIDVIVDRGAIMSGAAADGKPWLLYDLGHGYCSYDLFAKCKHRMACSKCSFYEPKDSAYSQMLEAKGNLLHMQQSISLSPEELSAVEDDIHHLDKLLTSLEDVPTPAGPTPNELRHKNPK